MPTKTTTKPIVLITGATQGIGLATAQRLAREHNCNVIIGARTYENGVVEAEKLRGEGCDVDVVQLDLLDDGSIAAATEYLTKTYGYLDVLVNNAGIDVGYKPTTPLPMREEFNTNYATNVTGTVCLTHSLAPLIRASPNPTPRVVFVSSNMASITVSLDPTTFWYNDDWLRYDTTKAALNIVMVNFARILGDCGALVNAVGPGWVATRATRYDEYGLTPYEGAQRIVEMATMTGKNSDVTATFSDVHGPIPW